MFLYEKKLQFPVKVATPNPKLASFIISQYGGPDGELGAAMRYLSQRYAMPYAEARGLLTDIGTEELGHMEMVAALVHQLTRNLSDEEVRNNASFAPYFVDHTTGVYPTAASGFPFGECLRLCKEKMDAKNIYLTNPAFDSSPAPQPRTSMAKG